MTSIGSTPRDSQSRAVSFAKVIFSAWKLLQQYFTISAARMEVFTNEAPVAAKRSFKATAAASPRAPAMVNGGWS
jgi:hypothetical protein